MKSFTPVNEFAVTISLPMGHLPHAKPFAKSRRLGYCARMKYLAVFATLLLALASLSAHAQATPDDQYISIYTQIQQADSLLAAGQTEQALNAYTQAYQQLQQFEKVFPDWNQRIVTFRLNYLEQKINDLTAKAPAPQSSPAATGTNAPSAAQSPPNASSGVDVNALQAQIKSLQDQNADLQAKLKEALSAQPAAANPQELEMAREQIKSLLKENEVLRAAVNQTSAPPVSANVKSLQKTLTETKQKLLEQTERADKLAQQNQALQAKLQPLLADANALEALREENAMLKKQVAAKSGKGNSAGSSAELAHLRAEIAVLQSDADVSWLERAALENRLRQAQSGTATNATVPVNASDFSATYQASPDTDQAQTAGASTGTNETEMAMTATAASNANETEDNSTNELPAGSAALADEAENYFNAHQYDKAEADYEKILQDDPKNSVALANLAAIEMEENKLSDAETHLQTALAENPNDAYNLSLEGYLNFREGNYDAALAALTNAAQLDPKNPQIQNYLGVTFSHKDRTDEAEAALLKAIELDPNYAAAHNNLAVIYLNENPPKTELARLEYQKALSAGQPRNPDLEKMLAAKGAPVAQQ